jgi:hypothetical protein
MLADIVKLTSKKMKSKICAICAKRLTEFGHDARPLANGRCCNECNHKITIPARLRARMAGKPEAAEKG